MIAGTSTFSAHLFFFSSSLWKNYRSPFLPKIVKKFVLIFFFGIISLMVVSCTQVMGLLVIGSAHITVTMGVLFSVDGEK